MAGKFILHTDLNDGESSPAEELLTGDAYDRNVEDATTGDLGLYYIYDKIEDKFTLAHVEQYESSETVSSKGGVTKKKTEQQPRSTWGDFDEENGDKYEVVRKTTPNKKVTLKKKGKVENGIRALKSKHFQKVRKKVSSDDQ